jgi:hypothetical protein
MIPSACNHLTVKKSVFFLCLLLIPAAAFCYHIRYNGYYLARLGISLPQFKIVAFSGNDKVLLGIEQVNNLKLRAKGYGWILRIFTIGQYDRIAGIRSVLLPAADIDNLALSDNGKVGIIISQYGTRIFQINLENGKLKTIFSYTPGKSGFRSDKNLCWFAHKSFYTEGYFYDKNGYYLSTDVVKFNLSHPNSVKLFEKKWNIRKTEKLLGVPITGWLVSGTEGFLGMRRPQSHEIILYYYHKGILKPIQRAKDYGGLAATSHRILYAALLKSGIRKLIIKDAKSNRTWILYSGKTPYLYPYLSRKGGHTAVAATMNLKKGVMSFFYAEQKNRFKLKPLNPLQRVNLGIFRLSPDGKHYAFLNKKGLWLGTIPSENPHSLPPPIY